MMRRDSPRVRFGVRGARVDSGVLAGAVRSEYDALADVTGALCGFFNYTPSAAQLGAVRQALDACERLDRLLDVNDGQRQARYVRVLRCIEGGIETFATSDPVDGEANSALEVAARDLRDALHPYWDAPSLRACLASIESATRRQRTRSCTTFIQAVQDEGTAFSALFSPIFYDAPPSFTAFFEALGAPGNLIDKFIDAKMDHAAGELLLRPTWAHRGRLLGAFVAHAPGILGASQKRGAFVRWTLRLMGKQFSATTARRYASATASRST